MKRSTLAYAALTAAALLLAGCTGTTELQPPTLLVTTYGDGASAEVALIEDTFGSADAFSGRLRFLTDSRRTLGAPAVALDVVDRAGERSELVLLTRDEADAAALRFFALGGIDASEPNAFAETRPALDVDALIRSGSGDSDLCLIDVQVDRDGRYAALLNDGRDCASGSPPALYLVDLRDGTLVRTFNTVPIVPAGLFIDQTLNRLYYLEAQVNNAAVKSFELPDGVVSPAPPVVEGSNQVALGPVGDAVVALRPSSFQAVVPGASEPLGEVVPTSSGAQELVDDPYGATAAVLVRGDNGFTVHATVDDPKGQTSSVTRSASDAALEPIGQFVYFLEEGAVRIFDLLTYEDDDSRNDLPGDLFARFDVPEIDTPGLISWTRATLPPTTP